MNQGCVFFLNIIVGLKARGDVRQVARRRGLVAAETRSLAVGSSRLLAAEPWVSLTPGRLKGHTLGIATDLLLDAVLNREKSSV
jgi:hypothetical protein